MGRRSGGMPDLVLVLPGGRSAFWEIKTDSGRLSDDQSAMFIAARNGARVCAIVRTIDDARVELVTAWGIADAGGVRMTDEPPTLTQQIAAVEAAARRYLSMAEQSVEQGTNSRPSLPRLRLRRRRSEHWTSEGRR